MSSVKDVAHGSRRNAYTALILSTLAMIVCFMSWSNFAPLASQVAEMFNLDVSQRTLLLATPVLLGSIMRIPAGILAFVGIAILTYRRMTCSRVYKTSDINDIIVDWALLITIVLGLACTITGAFIDYNYRTTISPWARSLFVLNPQWQLMRSVPLIYKIHVLCGLAIFGYFPYTRLVHALTLPWQYIFRRFIVYRRRARVY